MLSGSTGLVVAALVFVVVGAFFAASEVALLSISKVKVRQLLDAGVKRAKAVERLVNDKERMISSVLIGANTTTVVVSSIATTIAINMAAEDYEGLAVTVAAVITTIVVMVFSDITPKIIASKYSDKIALLVARPMVLVMYLLLPINLVLNGFISKTLGLFGFKKSAGTEAVTEQEVMTMLDMGYEDGVIPEEESQMIDAVLEFGSTHARDVMTPRTDMVAIGHDASYAQVMEVFRREQFSRLPVFKEDLDHIVGFINFMDFILKAQDNPDFDVTKHMREPLFVYETQHTKALFTQMRTRGTALAVVLDEYGGTCGILTTEDIVEEIMGDIFDEHDETGENIECIAEGELYRVRGNVRIDDFNEELSQNLTSQEYDTLAGYVMELFGYIPTAGEEIEHENIGFKVEKVEKNRVESILVQFNNSVCVIPPKDV